MTKSSLTERYIWAVTRQLPEGIGADVADELRSTLAETIEDKVAAGADPDAAEREALLELGDPDVLAREYGGRPNHLIGPALYPDFIMLLKALMLFAVVPTALLSFTIGVLTDVPPVRALLESAWLTFTVAVHVGFWTGLTFALVERSEQRPSRPTRQWDPTSLTADVPWRQYSTADMVLSAGFTLAVAAVVVWQFAGAPWGGIQILDPDLALQWQSVVVGLLLAEAVVTVLAWRVGRWTPTLAALMVVVNAITAVTMLWLLAREELLADLPTVLGERFGWAVDWSVATVLVAAGILVVTIWDAVDAVLRARRSLQAEGRAGGRLGQRQPASGS